MPPAVKPTVLVSTMAAFAVVCVGCGEVRPPGEAGGIPVTFSVDLDARYVDQLARTVLRPAPLFIGPPGYGYAGYGRYRPYGRPYGPAYCRPDPFWYDSGPVWTDVSLLGGDGPAEAGVFRMPLSPGHADFTIPIRAGHVVTLTVQARGDREGWEAVGHFTAADRPGQLVHLSLVAEGPRMEIIQPPEGPEPSKPDPVAPAVPAGER